MSMLSRSLCVQVQAGVGRTGKWWGHQHFEDLVPDIMLFAKGIGSGYPFAGIAAKPHLYAGMKPGSMGDHLVPPPFLDIP